MFMKREMDNREKNNRQVSRFKNVAGWIGALAITIAVVMVFRSKVFILANIPSGSMSNTINVGDKVYGNRLAYNWDTPKRGDVVIFYAPDEPDTLYIKRVIGLPGDKVVINNSKIYINDAKEPLREPYIKGKWASGRGYYEYDVPKDSYFMLGDNRDGSNDSRMWIKKYVTKDKIVAKAECIYFPFGDIKSLQEQEY